MSKRGWPKAIGLVLAAGLLVAACGSSNSSGGTTAKKYVVGVSNTLTGNGFREEMICSIKAQAKASGIVSKVIVANRNTDPSGQIADMRNLISSGANVIVLNPSDRSALDAVIKEATDKGIIVVTVDQGVTSTTAYQLYNNQVKYATLGADWLFKQMGGKGNVVEMRGINGVSADADRHQGFMATVANYPNIKVVKETFTNWSLDPAAQQVKDILASGLKVDGIWTSGIDSTVVDGYTTAKHAYVPVIGADNDAFLGQLINLKGQGLAGAAVTNPPTVGGAGLALGLDVLQGKTEPHLVNLDPQIWDNQSSTGLSALQSHYDPSLGAYYSVTYQVDPWTTYTKADLLGCANVG
ncbi:MAG TPA: substrate-binding domain-containing protein [Candidatus Dormibacteraeota bacterium]|nr:substrate-binding domain-containing protein [Candidatus Dormibacteraeota bacterium]